MISDFKEVRNLIEKQKKILNEIKKSRKEAEKTNNSQERNLIEKHVDELIELLKKESKNLPEEISKLSLNKTLPKENSSLAEKKTKFTVSEFEEETIKRFKPANHKAELKKEKKPSKYIQISNRFFSGYANDFLEKGKFKDLKTDLIKSNLRFLPKSYVSVLFFTTTIAVIASFFLFIFFLFFKISPILPFISLADEGIITRLGKVLWILIIIPIGTFFMLYLYPSIEKKSLEARINQELPFAAIHMSAIAGSMIDPTKIFEIIISTKEYPNLEKEFTKLINETNVLGYDLVTALRNRAFNSPSRKLSELFNGLATTINSGGDMVEFFSKRSQTLLFDYKLEREKYTRSSETFMDIYISVVIAAPMILMLLLMMMKISGLGVSLSTGAITLIMILGIAVVNLGFLMFLHLKQPAD